MNFPRIFAAEEAPVRLRCLSRLSAAEIEALVRSAETCQHIAGGRDIWAEGHPIAAPQIVLSGWAYRTRIFHDGRRQILGFLLPGDIIGMCRQSLPLAQTTITAISPLQIFAAPPAAPGSSLAEAYAISDALDDTFNLRHITRLGRMTAYERLADWLLEIRHRLEFLGMVSGTSFPLPVTQEMLADTLGLTSVHVNRTLQTMRRDGLLELRGGKATLHDRERLVGIVDWHPPIVTAAETRAG